MIGGRGRWFLLKSVQRDRKIFSKITNLGIEVCCPTARTIFVRRSSQKVFASAGQSVGLELFLAIQKVIKSATLPLIVIFEKTARGRCEITRKDFENKKARVDVPGRVAKVDLRKSPSHHGTFLRLNEQGPLHRTPPQWRGTLAARTNSSDQISVRILLGSD